MKYEFPISEKHSKDIIPILNFSNTSDFKLKRNFIFINDFKLFFTYFSSFVKRLKKFFFKSLLEKNENNSSKNKKLKSNFFFIAESNDPIFSSLFSSFSSQSSQVAFYIEWHPSKFFYYLRKKKFSSLNFFPIIIVAPKLYFNKDFMHALQSLKLFPIIFFFDRDFSLSQKLLNYKNVFSIFLNRKNNLQFLFLFFKFFIKAF